MDNETTATPTPVAKPAIPRGLLIAILAALLAVLAALVVLIVKPDSSGSGPKPVTEMSETERAALAKKLKADVEKHLMLPAETPEVIAAEDRLSELLAQGGFWANLERGDYILVFPEDARVVIWRPSKKLVVNMGPILNQEQESSPAAAEEETTNEAQ